MHSGLIWPMQGCKGEVAAERFVAGRPARIVAPVADVQKEPRPDAAMNTQFLRGDDVTVFDEAEGWAWVQAERDRYVGYVSAGFLGARDGTPTHVVSVPRTFLYPGADLKLPRQGELSLGSSVAVTGFAETRGTRYAVLSSAKALIAGHLMPVGEHAEDFVAVAEMLVQTPYLWGGASGFGIDCSGLVQLSMRMAGRDVLRNSDMQAETIGDPIEPGDGFSGLQRGDLVFWKGHVAIMTDEKTMIHANGHTMLVSREGLARRHRPHRLPLWRPDRIQAALANIPRRGRRRSAAARRVRRPPSAPASAPTRCAGSDVAAACGVTKTLGWFHSGLVLGSGSTSNTSRLASFSVPSSSARKMSASFCSLPRPALISTAPPSAVAPAQFAQQPVIDDARGLRRQRQQHDQNVGGVEERDQALVAAEGGDTGHRLLGAAPAIDPEAQPPAARAPRRGRAGRDP